MYVSNDEWEIQATFESKTKKKQQDDFERSGKIIH
jgi:hypothetical protein